MTNYDVAVIGGSAAGLSAALVLARARRKVLVIDSGSPRNAPAAHMHGFLSRDGAKPAELLDIGREEVRRYGGEIAQAAVTELTRDADSGFSLRLSDGRRVSARRVVIATGLRDELPDIPGLTERWARDVLHCPYCHGWEVRDQRLGVLGGSPDAVRFGQIVRQWSDDVTFFASSGSVSAEEHAQLIARGIAVVEGLVAGLVIDGDRLHGVEMTDGRVVPRDALFVPPRFVPHSELLAGLGCDVDTAGWPVRDATGRTTVPGVWVAGNVANPRAQVITAAGEGSTAAIALNADLVDEEVHGAVRAFATATVS